MTVLRGGGATDVGKVRSSNQDALLLADELFAVCDGVGGHQGGEVASATAAEALREHYTDHTLDGLIEAVTMANTRVWEKAQADPSLRGMGTTVTAVALVNEDGEERLAIVNVGDSRGYLVQQGELTQLTEDHSLVEQMYRDGRLSREEADLHPQRSLITRALGLEAEVDVDHWQVLPGAVDRILLCSDGLSNEVPDDRIAATLRRLADPEEAARELVRLANDAGGRDNITVVVVDVLDDDEAERASAALAGSRSGLASRAVEEGPDAEPGAPARRKRHAGTPDSAVGSGSGAAPGRRLTWRVALFTLVLLAVLGAAAGAVGWYARRTYYVGVEGGQVAIFKGRPGGLLWFDPTLEKRTGLEIDRVPQVRRDDVEDGHEVADLEAAERYVRNLEDEASRTFATTPGAPSTLPPNPPPTTTLPPP